MVAALKPQPIRRPVPTWVRTEARRHTDIAIAIWRCHTDNGYWPDVRHISKHTGIPPSIVSNDLLFLISEGLVSVRDGGYKLIVVRAV